MECCLGLGIGPPLQLAYALLHLFPGLERDDELLWYKDFIAGPRIAGLACGALFHLKDAKIPELDPLFLYQRLDDRVKCLLHDLLGLELGQPNVFGDRLDDLFLGHGTALLCMCPTSLEPTWPQSTRLARSKCNWRKH